MPFNIAIYALLTHMIAQVNEQLSRDPYPLPQLELNPIINHIFDFTFDDIKIFNYQCHPTFKGEVSV